ncbi:MAG: hypothetical protein EOM21_14105 [Gammaproteobacteria bacterium]|nr:hypothetical protein [Gammaproteobacteria bacterium]
MLIELTIRRPHGTRVNVLGTPYHFTAKAEGEPHVAEVFEPAHIEHFLSIRAFREIKPPAVAPVRAEQPRKPVRSPKAA